MSCKRRVTNAVEKVAIGKDSGTANGATALEPPIIDPNAKADTSP